MYCEDRETERDEELHCRKKHSGSKEKLRDSMNKVIFIASL